MVFAKFSNFISVSQKKSKSDTVSSVLKYHPLEKNDLQIEAVGLYTVFLIFFHFTELYTIGLLFQNMITWPDSQEKNNIWSEIWTLID